MSVNRSRRLPRASGAHVVAAGHQAENAVFPAIVAARIALLLQRFLTRLVAVLQRFHRRVGDRVAILVHHAAGDHGGRRHGDGDFGHRGAGGHRNAGHAACQVRSWKPRGIGDGAVMARHHAIEPEPARLIAVPAVEFDLGFGVLLRSGADQLHGSAGDRLVRHGVDRHDLARFGRARPPPARAGRGSWQPRFGGFHLRRGDRRERDRLVPFGTDRYGDGPAVEELAKPGILHQAVVASFPRQHLVISGRQVAQHKAAAGTSHGSRRPHLQPAGRKRRDQRVLAGNGAADLAAIGGERQRQLPAGRRHQDAPVGHVLSVEAHGLQVHAARIRRHAIRTGRGVRQREGAVRLHGGCHSAAGSLERDQFHRHPLETRGRAAIQQRRAANVRRGRHGEDDVIHIMIGDGDGLARVKP